MTAPATILEAAAALRAGTTTSAELVAATLEAADERDAALGCFVARFDRQALEAAAAADHAFATGVDAGPLQGIPIALKDLIAAREGATTAQSPVFAGRWDGRPDATVTARLREAGAVIVGKTSLNEFAVGFPNEGSGFPMPLNPWALDRWPGGSSSGTAVGVAAGLFLGGLGTDTGGSARIPAALCGVTGLKPTYGRVPITGVVPLAWSLDTIGTMARSAEDCAALLDAIGGHDPDDPTSATAERVPLLDDLPADLTGLRIGVERAHHSALAAVDRDVVAAFEAALDELAAAGATIEDIVVEHADLAATAGSVIVQAESLAYHRTDLRSRWKDYGPVTRQVLASGALHGAADYVQAQRCRTVVAEELSAVLRRVDVVATPTVGMVAPTFDSDFVSLIPLFFTGLWNLTGFPAISLPAGLSPGGLPIGLQLGAAPFRERRLVEAGAAYQRRTEWHLRRPAA